MRIEAGGIDRAGLIINNVLEAGHDRLSCVIMQELKQGTSGKDRGEAASPDGILPFEQEPTHENLF